VDAPYLGRSSNWTSNQRHTVHVTLYCTWRPSGLATGLHGQGWRCLYHIQWMLCWFQLSAFFSGNLGFFTTAPCGQLQSTTASSPAVGVLRQRAVDFLSSISRVNVQPALWLFLPFVNINCHKKEALKCLDVRHIKWEFFPGTIFATEAVPDTTSGSCYVTIEVNPVSVYKVVHYFDH